jgi:hypothetical protein
MWLSADPAMGEYVPQAPVNDEAKKHNENLPGLGGVFNYVNLHAYHYAGNNSIRYTDPNGESLGDLLEGAQEKFENYVTQFIEDHDDLIKASSGRVTLQLGKKTLGGFALSGSLIIEATGDGKIKLQVEGAVDFKILGGNLGEAEAKINVGLRLSYKLGEFSKDKKLEIGLSPKNISSLNLAIDATLNFSDGIGANGHVRKSLYDFNTGFSWKDLAAKDWVVGGQLNFGEKLRVAGRFNISRWLGYE